MKTLFEVEEEEAGLETPELPELVGSDKQKPWAEAVRKKASREIERLLCEWQAYIRTLQDGGKDERAEHERDQLRQALSAADEILAQTACGWWIDRRQNTARELLNGAPARPGNSLYRG